MKTLFRIVATFLVAVFVFYFVFWMGGALMRALIEDHLPAQVAMTVSIVIAAATAAVAVRYVWKHTNAPDGLVKDMTMGGLLVGAVGFCGGFLGPMIFSPESNQGPLLGLFITGPLGMMLGVVGGAIFGIVKRKPAPKLAQRQDG